MKTTAARAPATPAPAQQVLAAQEAQADPTRSIQPVPGVEHQMNTAATLGHRFEQADVYSHQTSAGPSSRNSSPPGDTVVQRQEAGAKRTGEQHTAASLPKSLRTGIEALSGKPMHDVRVHYDSDKPAAYNALAFAQGTDIHLAPGQEQHLPHEAWHIVQQKQQRVVPTAQMKSAPINDDASLEREATVMGARASQGMAMRPGGDAGEMARTADQHTAGCGCAACAASSIGPAVPATPQLQAADGQSTVIQKMPVIQLARCQLCGQRETTCTCPGGPYLTDPAAINTGEAPTGRTTNTSGHHDPAKTPGKARPKERLEEYAAVSAAQQAALVSGSRRNEMKEIKRAAKAEHRK